MTSDRTAAVASGHPLATTAGIEALQAGGSAVDAALAAAFTQWTVNSPLCGPGGEMLVMVVTKGEPTVYGGWSRTPTAFPALDPIPYSGPQAAVIPGAVPAAHTAWRDHGRLAWSTLFAASIRAATRGHIVTDWMANSYSSTARKHPAAVGLFLDQARVPGRGDVVTARRFADTLSALAHEGPAALHGGHLGSTLAAASQAAGGFITEADLAAASPAVGPAESAELTDGLTLHYPGSPSQSSMIVDILRASHAGQPAESAGFAAQVAPVTEEGLVRRCVVGLNGTATAIAAAGGTAAVIVHSLAGVQYGTGWFAGQTGIALGNRVGTAHSTRPDLPGAHARPGHHPAHTLSAAFLRRGSRSVLVATPGGDRQVQWLAQTAQRFRQGHTLDELVTAPRWFVCPEGDRFGVPGGIGAPWYLFAEPGIAWRDNINLAGYDIKRVASVGGGLQAVEYMPAAGWTSASDPRAGGSAAVSTAPERS